MRKVVITIVLLLACSSSSVAVLDSVTVEVILDWTPASYYDFAALGYPGRNHVMALPNGAKVLYIGGGGPSLYLSYDDFATMADSLSLKDAWGRTGDADHIHFFPVDSTIYISDAGSTTYIQGFIGVVQVDNGQFVTSHFGQPTLASFGGGDYRFAGVFLPLPASVDSFVNVWRNDARTFDISANWSTDTGTSFGSAVFVTDLDEVSYANGSRLGADHYDNTVICAAYFRDDRAFIKAFNRGTGTWQMVGDTVYAKSMQRWFDFNVLNDTIIYFAVPGGSNQDTVFYARYVKGDADWTEGTQYSLCDSCNGSAVIRLGVQLSEIEASGRMVAFFVNNDASGNDRIYMRYFVDDSLPPSDSTYTIIGSDTVQLTSERFSVVRHVPAVDGDKTYLYYSQDGNHRVVEITFWESEACTDISLSEAPWWHLDTCERVIVDYECIEPVSKIVLLRDADAEITGASRVDSITAGITNPDTLHLGGLTKNTQYFYWIEMTTASGVDTSLVQWVTTRNADVFIVDKLPDTVSVDHVLIRPHPDSAGVLHSDHGGLLITGVHDTVRGWEIRFNMDSSGFAAPSASWDEVDIGIYMVASTGSVVDSMTLHQGYGMTYSQEGNQDSIISAIGVRWGGQQGGYNQKILRSDFIVKGNNSVAAYASGSAINGGMYNLEFAYNEIWDSAEALPDRQDFYSSTIYFKGATGFDADSADFQYHYYVHHNKVHNAHWVNLAYDNVNSDFLEDNVIRQEYNSWYIDQLNRYDDGNESSIYDTPANGYAIVVRAGATVGYIRYDTIRTGTNYSGGRGILMVRGGKGYTVDSSLSIYGNRLWVSQGWNGYDQNTNLIEMRERAKFIQLHNNTITSYVDNINADFARDVGGNDSHALPGETFDHIGPHVNMIKVEALNVSNDWPWGDLDHSGIYVYNNRCSLYVMSDSMPVYTSAALSGRQEWGACLVWAAGPDTTSGLVLPDTFWTSYGNVLYSEAAFYWSGSINGGARSQLSRGDTLILGPGNSAYQYLGGNMSIAGKPYDNGPIYLRGIVFDPSAAHLDTLPMDWSDMGAEDSAAYVMQQQVTVNVDNAQGQDVAGAWVFLFDNATGDSSNHATALDSGQTDGQGNWTSRWVTYHADAFGAAYDSLRSLMNPFTAQAVLGSDTGFASIDVDWSSKTVTVTLQASEPQQHNRVRRRGIQTYGVEIR